MGGSGTGGGVAHVPPFARYAAWFMLAGQEFVNKVVRLAIPYIVPFIAQEQAFTAAQTARLLTGFSLGYVTCQVPAGYISTVLGPKFVQLCNNIGLTLLFLGLPSLARRGSMAVFGAVLGVGVLQGEFRVISWLPSFATVADCHRLLPSLCRPFYDCSPRNVVQLVSRGGLARAAVGTLHYASRQPHEQSSGPHPDAPARRTIWVEVCRTALRVFVRWFCCAMARLDIVKSATTTRNQGEVRVQTQPRAGAGT